MSNKRNSMDEKEHKNYRNKRRRPRIKLEDAPPVSSLRDLIDIGKNIKFYRNLDTIMLWRITPYLEELNNFIGMEKLKESIFYQVIYYLQGMHSRNQNQEYLHTIITGPPGTGKCLAKDTPVMMFDGTIKFVQNIKKGELLMGDDSKPRNVLSTCHGFETLYKIRQEYGDDYIVNESHILSLMLNNNAKMIDTPSQSEFTVTYYTIKDCISYKIKYNERNKREIKDNIEEKLKLLPKKGDIINISVKDYLIKNIQWKSAYKGYKVSVDFPHNDLKCDPYEMGRYIGCMINFMDIYNLDPEVIDYYNLTSTLSIPLQFIFNSKTNRKHFLDGLIESNSEYFRNHIIINSNSKEITSQIIFLCRSLGLKSFIKSNKNRIYVCNYNNYSDNNKKISYNISVDRLSNGEYFGFEIDKNKRFLLGDFTVTHNTSVAKIIAKIYQSMDILSKSGKFKIAYRDDFVAEYLGQTAVKTKKLLKSCLGGVLFIDEVYALGPGVGDKDSFSKEALDTLNAFLSEHKNDFCCIAAGYEEDIKKCFFSVNKGLKRRFPWIHKIDEYTSSQLADIAFKMIKEMEWETNVNNKDFTIFIEKNKDFFKFAGGDIETFLTKCKMTHAKRVFNESRENKFIISIEDMNNALDIIKKYNLDEENNKAPYGMYT